MLILIGLGLETKDISVRGLEAANAAAKVYLEQYTTFISDEYLAYLKSEIKQQMTVLGRSELEEKVKETINEAKTKDIAILVPGDALIATTHHTTILDTAKQMKIKTKVYHASSIYSAAIGESGLDVYRFGQTVTIPFWYENYKPTSYLDVIKKNLLNDEHTLLLLDLNQKEKRTMSLDEAVAQLKAAENEKLYDIIDDNLKILVLGNVGRETQELAYFRIGDAKKMQKRFNGKILSMIIPATLNFAEEEALGKFKQV
jgi:diphthine synthase